MAKRKKGKKGKLFFAFVLLVCIVGYLSYIGMGVKYEAKKVVLDTIEVPFQEVHLSEDELAGKYYYLQLGEKERRGYREIVQGVKDQLTEIYVHMEDADKTNELFRYVLKDFPEIFWCEGTIVSTSYEGAENYTVLKPQYLYDKGTREAMSKEIEEAVNECLAGISPEADDYQKILYVYELIVNTVEYDMEASDNQNIYSVFGKKRSVCAGYSKATQYLLERLGVFCTYVTGSTTGGQSHAWNLVNCNGDYYYVDTTWGDPVFQAAGGVNISVCDNISYDYMCCDDTELFRTHAPDQDVKLPACTKLDYNYYVVNGMYYTEYDSDTALLNMNEIILQRGNPVVLKFADSNLYNQAREDVFENVIKRAAQNLAEWYGLTEVKYQYTDEADLNKITVYWQYE